MRENKKKLRKLQKQRKVVKFYSDPPCHRKVEGSGIVVKKGWKKILITLEKKKTSVCKSEKIKRQISQKENRDLKYCTFEIKKNSMQK